MYVGSRLEEAGKYWPRVWHRLFRDTRADKKALAWRVCYETAGLEVGKSDVRKLRASLFAFGCSEGVSSLLRGQGLSELDCAQHIQHALQVIDHRGQANLRLRTLQSTKQEAWISKNAVLQRGERMLHRGSS